MKKAITLILASLLILCVFCSCGKNNNMDEFWEFYNGKLDAFEKENEEYKNKDVDVVFLGDSLTDGYDVKRFYPEYVVLKIPLIPPTYVSPLTVPQL